MLGSRNEKVGNVETISKEEESCEISKGTSSCKTTWFEPVKGLRTSGQAA
jgi:hypothetical protein